ncbi:MAG: DUF5665 domain-containing protein [Candidatus Omnitrophota bacterium]|nr:hypothetical protein [Candidatus Omnitrophota bacterium]
MGETEKKPEPEKKEEIEFLLPHQVETVVQQLRKALASDTQELLQMMRNPRKFMWQNFMLGVVRGLGIVFGMTILGALLVAFFFIVLRWLENLPLIGGLVHRIVNLIRDFMQTAPVNIK